MIGAYATDQATLSKRNAPDKYGEPTSPTVTSIMGYHERKSRLVRNAQGEQVASSGSYHTEASVAENDKLTISGTEYLVIRVDGARDFAGSHSVAWLA